MEELSSALDSIPIEPGWIQIAVGAVLLLFGRRLFFLLLGAAGFLLGFALVSSGLPESLGWTVSPDVRLVVALVAGVMGAALAFVVQRVALVVAGLLLGGVAAWQVIGLAGIDWNGLELLLVVAGAVLGAALIRGLFAVVLIGVSAWIGTSLILPATGLEGTPAVLAGLFLLMIGIAVQAGEGRSKREEKVARRRRERKRA
ncbi:MAG TPA: hypothetical protein VMT85_14375 [Thermoanaerobaculia bacterium]|nr:hypothetical protein [Thermoanaerobaculia bacterium]